MGNSASSKYAADVDGRRVPKPGYVKDLARREALETRKRDWKANFLRAYASNGNITKSCREADIDPRIFYKARKEDVEFAESFAIAHRAATDKALEAVWQMGVEGTREPIIYQGEVVGYHRTRDFRATRFLLETMDPGTYSQKERIAQMGMRREDELNARRDQMLADHQQKMSQFRSVMQPRPIPSETGDVQDAEVVDDSGQDS